MTDATLQVLPFEASSVAPKAVHSLIIKAFDSRLKEGLRFSLVGISEEALYEDWKGSHVVVALLDGTLAGTIMYTFKTQGNEHYVNMSNMAVDPACGGRGIGTAMVAYVKERAVEAGADYIRSDTAVGAKSSVRLHLNSGFKIVGFYSFRSTNYYSYLFRLQLSSPSPWLRRSYRVRQFVRSFLEIWLRFRADGKRRSLSRFWRRLTGKD